MNNLSPGGCVGGGGLQGLGILQEAPSDLGQRSSGLVLSLGALSPGPPWPALPLCSAASGAPGPSAAGWGSNNTDPALPGRGAELAAWLAPLGAQGRVRAERLALPSCLPEPRASCIAVASGPGSSEATALEGGGPVSRAPRAGRSHTSSWSTSGLGVSVLEAVRTRCGGPAASTEPDADCAATSAQTSA